MPSERLCACVGTPFIILDQESLGMAGSFNQKVTSLFSFLAIHGGRVPASLNNFTLLHSVKRPMWRIECTALFLSAVSQSIPILLSIPRFGLAILRRLVSNKKHV